jgi:hypothetical protein
MASNGRPTIDLVRDSNLWLDGLRAAAHATFREHKLLGLPIAIWKDGQAVWLQPEDITPEDMGEAPSTNVSHPPVDAPGNP